MKKKKIYRKHKLPEVTQEEIENVNRPITSKTIDSVFKIPSKENSKFQEYMASLVSFFKHLKKNLYKYFSNISNKWKRPALP